MTYRINLLSKPEVSLIEKVLYFFLNYLRYILVFTQIVVIGVLFYRFRIDQNIIDLKDSLAQKKEIVAAVKPLLDEAEKVNNQSIAIKKVASEQNIQLSALKYIMSIFPESVSLTSLSIGELDFTLKGTTSDSRQLQLFYARLQTDKRFKSVTLSNIRRVEEGYMFDLVLSNYNNKILK